MLLKPCIPMNRGDYIKLSDIIKFRSILSTVDV